MAHWLLKTEPEDFSWADLIARGPQGEPWTGVRNHQAKNFLKDGNIIKAAYPDPTDPAWFVVDVVAQDPLKKPVGLADIKSAAELAEMALVRNGRLSVQPVTPEQWSTIMAMSQVKRA
jgi:predicted RNA-binding protein with PUA-like domain